MTKYKLSRKAWAIVACMLLASFWVSCKDDLGAVGLGVLPKGDIIYSSEKTDKNIQAYTQTVNSVETERAGSYLLGCLNDPHVGKTTADFAIQMRIPGHPNFEKDAVLDSVTLTLPYHEVYGDTSVLVPPLSQPMRIRVHELSQDLDYDHKYPSNTDLNSMSKSESLIYGASYFEYRPFMRWDDRTTKYYKQIQTIHIRLSDEFGKRLMAIDSTQMLSNDRFVKVFKGLHISVDDQNSGKSSLVRINPSLSTTNSSSVTTTESFEIRLYKKSPTSGRTDTIVYYTVGQLSASVNHFAHDYSKTRFANKLNNEAEVDSFIYVQPMAGLRSKINIPNLKNWKDSSNIIINKAKVTFFVDTTKNSIPDLINSVSGNKFNGIANFNIPDSLQLLPLDKNGDTYYPRDYIPSSSYYSTNLLVYGGHYNNTAGVRSYSFGITKHLQDIIDNKVQDYGFVLVVPYAAVEDKRVVLEGPKNNRGIRLDVVYTKYKTKPTLSSQ